MLLRLFNTTDAPQQVTVECAKDRRGVWYSNPLEEKLADAPARLALEKYEIVTLRIQ
jgi:hypothetical protein